jgi:signal transduction histidine kinase
MSSVPKLETRSEVNAEIVAAEGLRASHDVISVLERCKSSSEQIIQNLPDLFVIMDRTGRILKGNAEAAKLLNCDYEHLLNKNIYDVFTLESKNIFKSRISVLLKDLGIKQLQYELSCIDEAGHQAEFLWTISKFGQISERRGPLIKVLGKNISKVKEFEKKLSQIFSAIPLGIFTVNSGGEIEWPYSLYSEFLLGDSKLAGKHIEKVLFEPIWEHLDPIERTGAMQVVDCIGGDTLWFDLAKLHFPREVKHTRQTPDGLKSIWLGITYHPITHENIVEKLMIVLEDRTEVVEARRALEMQREIENNKVKRILEIQSCSGSLLEVTFSDFEELFPRLKREVESLDIEKVARTLHAIKGIARTARFSDLEYDVHQIEDTVVDHLKAETTVDPLWISESYEKIRQEWVDLKSLVFALSGKQHGLHLNQEDFSVAIHELSDLRRRLDDAGKMQADKILERLGGGNFAKVKELSTLEPKLIHQKEATCQALGKDVDLIFDWAGVQVIQNEMLTFTEIFLHVINNAIDHGIEAGDARKAAGKQEKGKIVIKAVTQGNKVRVDISDDGGGIDRDKVIRAAIRREILDPVDAPNLNREQVYDLLLRPGFSSREVANHISGRGIGLDSVNEAVRSLGGKKLNIKSEDGKGTTFWFEVPLT